MLGLTGVIWSPSQMGDSEGLQTAPVRNQNSANALVVIPNKKTLRRPFVLVPTKKKPSPGHHAQPHKQPDHRVSVTG